MIYYQHEMNGIAITVLGMKFYCAEYRTAIENWRGAMRLIYDYFRNTVTPFDINEFKRTYLVERYRTF